jgi:hypothetical protein
VLLYAGACRAARLVSGAGAGPGAEVGHGSSGRSGVEPLLLCDDGRQLGFAPPADALLSALADPALPAAAADEILALLQHQARPLRPPPPPSRTKWTRLVHPSVLIGHAPLKLPRAPELSVPPRLRAFAPPGAV